MMNDSLSLPRLPPITFFFGLAGVGKNYVGDLVAKLTDRPLYHADCDLTPVMRQAIADERPFTQEMRDEYFKIIGENILARFSQHSQLIVTQGAYKASNRQYLSSLIPQLEFVLIKADDKTIVDRLLARGDMVSLEYAKVLQANFEAPPPETKAIHNNADDKSIIDQLIKLFG